MALGLAALVMVGMLSGCSQKLDNDEVAITMGDTQITAGVANFYARYQQAQYETYYASFMGEDMWENEVEDGKIYEDTVKEGIIESLETLYLLEAHMGEYDVTITEEEKESIKQAAEGFVDANEEDEKAAVSGDVSIVEKVLELLTIQEKMYDVMVADVDSEVSDDEAAQKKMTYVKFALSTTDEEGNSVDLTEDEIATLKEEASDFAKSAKSEEDFSAFATAQGYEPAEATFDAESTTPAAEVIEVVDGLKEGECTEVIETETAYYVAKVESLLDREATDAKKASIVQERKDAQYQEITEGWIEEAKPVVNESVFKKMSFKKQGVLIKDTTTEEEAAEE